MDISSVAGVICPYCHTAIQDTDAIYCGSCGTKHHKGCWQSQQGCAVSGCASAPTANTTTQAVNSSTSIIPPTPVINPAQYVQAAQYNPPPEEIYFEGNNTIIVRDGGSIPPVCILTGKKTNLLKKKRKESWAPPWVMVFILLGLLIALIIYIVIQKSAQIHYHISKEEASKRTNYILMNWGVFLATFIGAIVCFSNSSVNSSFAGVGLLLIIGSIVAPSIIYAKLIQMYAVKKINNGYVWIKVKNQRIYDAIYNAYIGRQESMTR